MLTESLPDLTTESAVFCFVGSRKRPSWGIPGMDPGAKRLFSVAQRPQGTLGPGAKRLFEGAQRPQGPLGPGAERLHFNFIFF